jgi:hypothetical protein
MSGSVPFRAALRVAVTLLAVLAMLPAVGAGQARAQDGGQATITINSFTEDGSTPLPFARFQVTDSNGTVYGPLESAPPDGKVTFTVDVVDDATTFEIVEETPPACAVAPDPVEVGPLAADDAISVDISTSFQTSGCTQGSISIYAYSCPDGTDPGATDYAVFQGACTTTVDGKSYRIAAGNGGQTFDLVTGAYGISGRAPLVGLMPGAYTVTDQKPTADTETVVFCATYPGAADGTSTPDSVVKTDVSDDAIALQLDGNRIACDFFAVPTAQNGGGDAEPTQAPTAEPVDVTPTADEGDGEVQQGGGTTGNAALEVHLSACPAGYSGSDWFDDCHDNGIEGRTITLEGPNGYTADAQTTLPNDPGPGVVRFEELEGGDYKVSEDVPGDTATYYAYCSLADSDTVVDFTYDDSTSESIRLTIDDGAQVVCDLYIIPDDQQGGGTDAQVGKITITKYTCDAGYDSEAYNDLASDCTDKTDGVTFTLSPQSGGSAQEAVTGASGTTGRVRFVDLEPARYDVSEDVPGEFSRPVVWCNVAGGEWYHKEVTDNGAATFDVAAGDDIRCSWFNLPEDLRGGGSLRIHKSICPAGLTSGYYANCYDDTLGGVTFNAGGPAGYAASLTTGNDGVVTFQDLNAGTYTIAEIPPDSVNVAVYVVVCTQNGQTYDFDYDDTNGLKINIKIPAGGDIVCDWYNVPPAKQPTGQGSITVIKALCQGKENNAYDWANDCDPFGAGADFALTSISTGTTTSGSTGSNSKLVFSGLANGSYALEETNGDWCHAEADHVDAGGNVVVQNGGNTNVYIYNCGKKVNTLPATGTGPMPNGGIGGMMALWGAVSIAALVTARRARRPRPVYATVRRAA